jgi:hypothetical protein
MNTDKDRKEKGRRKMGKRKEQILLTPILPISPALSVPICDFISFEEEEIR